MPHDVYVNNTFLISEKNLYLIIIYDMYTSHNNMLELNDAL